MIKRITTIGFVSFALFLALASSVSAGEYLGEWRVTRYYVPEPNQTSYANGWRVYDGTCNYKNMYWAGWGNHGRGDYSADVCMNGKGNFADGTSVYDVYQIVFACPPNIPLGTILHVSNIGYGICRDRGGAIKGDRLDVFTGVGQYGFENHKNYAHGLQTVHLLQ